MNENVSVSAFSVVGSGLPRKGRIAGQDRDELAGGQDVRRSIVEGGRIALRQDGEQGSALPTLGGGPEARGVLEPDREQRSSLLQAAPDHLQVARRALGGERPCVGDV